MFTIASFFRNIVLYIKQNKDLAFKELYHGYPTRNIDNFGYFCPETDAQ